MRAHLVRKPMHTFAGNSFVDYSQFPPKVHRLPDFVSPRRSLCGLTLDRWQGFTPALLKSSDDIPPCRNCQRVRDARDRASS